MPKERFQNPAFSANESRVERAQRVLIVVLALSVVLQEAKPPRFSVLSTAGLGGGGPLFLQEYVLLALVLTAFLRGGQGVHLPQGVRQARVAAVAFFVWGAAALLGASFFLVPIADGAWGNVRMLVGGATAFIIVTSIQWSDSWIARAIFTFVCAMIVHSIVLWIDFASPGLLPFETVVLDGGGTLRLSGLFLQPSRAGFMLAIALVLALSRALYKSTARSRRSFYLIALPVLASGVMLTQTRGAILAAVVGVLYALWRSKSHGWLLLAGALGALATLSGVILRFDVLRLGLSRFSATSGAGGTERSDVYSQVGEFIMIYPLGGGAGGLYEFSGGLRIPHAHNMYLQVAVMFGIPGLLLFLYWIATVFRVSQNRFRDNDESLAFGLWLGLRSALIVALAAFMTEPFLITNVGLWFWVYAGLLVSMGAQSRAAIGHGAWSSSAVA